MTWWSQVNYVKGEGTITSAGAGAHATLTTPDRMPRAMMPMMRRRMIDDDDEEEEEEDGDDDDDDDDDDDVVQHSFS